LPKNINGTGITNTLLSSQRTNPARITAPAGICVATLSPPALTAKSATTDFLAYTGGHEPARPERSLDSSGEIGRPSARGVRFPAGLEA